MVMFSLLKEIRNSIRCAGISIWLLSEEESRLECMYAAGSDAPNILGRFIRSKKFTVLYQQMASRQLKFEEIPYANWMDRSPFKTLNSMNNGTEAINVRNCSIRFHVICTRPSTSMS
jgi:hypothetical protein